MIAWYKRVHIILSCKINYFIEKCKMNKKLIFALVLLLVSISVDGRKTSRSRSSGSGRGSSRKTNYNPQPAPTSFSYPQPSAPKPSLSGWQERPAQRSQSSSSWQSKPGSSQSHSYPSSSTGLSGNSQPKQPPSYQESIQRNSAPHNLPGQQTPNRATQSQTNNQPSHSYPSSNGLSGNTGAGYPQQQGGGLSGSGAAPPPYTGYKPGDTNRPYNGASYPTNNVGNNYHHPQGAPPPYTPNIAPNYGGYGGHGSYNPGYGSQMPGYFGNYANHGKGFGSVSRTGSALTGVGIAGAGVGTLLTGLALWNLARSTGNHHHTVIYDNRGQPVAVAPNNNTAPAVDPILGDLVNCTLTIGNENTTEVLAIPCAIATSFTPEADVKDLGVNNNANDNTKCTITVVTKEGKEFMTTIPCAVLLNTAAENNVTEPPILNNDKDIGNATEITPEHLPLTNHPSALKLSDEEIQLNNTTKPSCIPQPGDVQDPINPCYSVTHDLTVIPLQSSNSSISLSTPSSA